MYVNESLNKAVIRYLESQGHDLKGCQVDTYCITPGRNDRLYHIRISRNDFVEESWWDQFDKYSFDMDLENRSFIHEGVEWWIGDGDDGYAVQRIAYYAVEIWLRSQIV